MSRAPGQRTATNRATSSRTRPSGSNDTRQTSSTSAKSTTSSAQEAKVNFNEALASLSRAAKEKVDVKSIKLAIDKASSSLKTLRECTSHASQDTNQTLTLDAASSAFCGHLIDVKAYQQAKLELTTLSLSLRRRLGFATAPSDLTWPQHLAVPLSQDTSTLSPALVHLVISTQLQILAATLRPANTQTDWAALAALLTFAFQQPGHPLQWRAYLEDCPESSERSAQLERIDRKLSSIYATVLKCTAGVDSSSSTALYDPDSLLRIRLYAIKCGLWSPSWSPQAQDVAVQSSRESFWDEARRTFGYYIRSVTTLKFPTAMGSLTELLQPLLDVATMRHPQLLAGPKLDALKSMLAEHAQSTDQLDNKMAKLSIKTPGASPPSNQDLVKDISNVVLNLDKWRRSKSAGDSPSTRQAIQALQSLPEADPILITSRVALSKAFAHAGSNKDQSALKSIYEVMDAWVACTKRLWAQTSVEMQSQCRHNAVDLIVQMAQHDINLSPTRADNLIEEGSCLLFDDLNSPNKQIQDFHAARVLSAASYNLGGILQRVQGHSDGLCARFFNRACLIGQAAISAFPQHKDAPTLRAQMPNRWGVLASAFQAMGERKGSLDATLEALQAGIFKLANVTNVVSAEALLHYDKTLVTLVTAYTRLATLDLFQSPQQVSLSTVYADHVSQSTLGAILETQLIALERSVHKERAKLVMNFLFEELFDIYQPTEMPLRRAKTMLHRARLQSSAEPLSQLKDFFDSCLGLLSIQNLSLDTSSADQKLSLLLQAHFLYALKIYQAPSTSSNNLEASELAGEQVAQALSCLRCNDTSLKPATSPTRGEPLLKAVSSAISPSNQAKCKTAATASTSIRTVRNKPRVASAPLQTPRSASSKAPLRTPKNTAPPARAETADQKAQLSAQTMELSRQVVHLLALLGMPFLRLQLLQQLAKLSDALGDTEMQSWVLGELAGGWLALGNKDKALANVDKALSAGPPALNTSARISLLLRKAQCQASNGDTNEAFATYNTALEAKDSDDARESGDSAMQDLLQAIAASITLATIHENKGSINHAISALQHCLQNCSRGLSVLIKRSKVESVKSSQKDEDVLEGPASVGTQEPGVTKDCSLWALQLYILRFLALSHLIQLSLKRGSCKAAASFTRQQLHLVASLDSPILKSQAVCMQAELYLLQDDVESAGTELNNVESLFNQDRDVEAVEMSRLLGLLAEGLALWPDAQAHYLAGQAKLAVLCELFGSQVSLSRSDCSKILPKMRAVLSKHQGMGAIILPWASIVLIKDMIRSAARLQVLAGMPVQPLLDAFESVDDEDKAEHAILQAKSNVRTVQAACEKSPAYSLVAESSISLPPINIGAVLRKDVLSRRLQGLLLTADDDLKEAFALSRALSNRSLASLCLDSVALRVVQRAMGIGEDSHAAEVAAVLDYRSNLTQQAELSEAIVLKLRQTPPAPQDWIRVTKEDAVRENLDRNLLQYWNNVRSRIEQRQPQDSVQFPKTARKEWQAISISLDKENNRIYITQHRPGRSRPLTFSLLMDRVGRRESEEQPFDFQCAQEELSEIIERTNATSREAKHVASEEDKTAWWSERRSLDERLKVELENIEHRWLGVFKIMLKTPREWPNEALDEFLTSATRILHGSLLRRKTKSNAFEFDADVLSLFAQISPTASHEDLEDFLHYIIESHQFAGASIVFDEIDLDQVATDLRVCLERLNEASPSQEDGLSHTFLILDKDAQKYPWESLPTVRGQSFSRIPNLPFLTDMETLLPCWSTSKVDKRPSLDRFEIPLNNTYYMLDPAGDLSCTQSSFASWLKCKPSWRGVCGKQPMPFELEQGLGGADLFIYIGHGGAEEYIRTDTLRKLPRCAVTFLWGCSSGTLRARGQFGAEGTPWNYMMAGCPTLVANLWDVTDKDIDKLTRATFEKSGFHAFGTGLEEKEGKVKAMPVSIPQAVAKARDCCRMRFLNGAAPVVYGIPAWIKDR